MADPRTYRCTDCGKSFEYSGSGSPKRCPPCRPSKNRARAKKRAEARGDVDLVKELHDTDEERAVKAATQGQRVHHLAVALGACGGDAQQAAALVGLLDARDLDELADEARSLKGFVDASPTELGRSLQRIMLRASLRMEAELPLFPRAQLPSVVQSLAKVREMMDLGDKSYTSLTVNLMAPPSPEPKDKDG